ncbi:DNA damage-inducible protein 1 [Entomophthora muscae]|uniref:DNA damage-inducible protein 1 n=1 Tax=Entomophthora muscae TaxID=34485 RepID=A0ACC2UNJ5_9FUNG|nr:DNA damage-inducible protein 1 [Entomophthora muscae]
MGNKKPFSKFQQKRPGVNVVLQEEEPEDHEGSSEGDGCRESPSPEPEPPPTKCTSSEGIFAVLSSPVPGTKGPPRRSERLQARKALAQAIYTTIENPTANLYLLQSVESDDTDPQDDPDSPSIFMNVSVSLPLHTTLKVVPGLESALFSLREALNPQGIHATLPRELCNPILHLGTWIEITVFYIPIREVLDTGAPTRIISSRLARRLGFLPDILHAESFFTAGVKSIKSSGTYSSISLRFGELVVTYLAVVLESEPYDMLISTDFLRTYQTEISHLHGHFSILGYTVPLLFKDSSDVFMVSKEEKDSHHVCLQYPHGVLGLLYRVENASVKPLPTYGDNQKGLKLRSNNLVRIPPQTQVAVDTGLYLDLPLGLHLEISSINGILHKELLVTPVIHESAAQETFNVLFLNLLSTEMKVSK